MKKETLVMFKEQNLYKRPLVYICSRYRAKTQKEIKENIKEACALGRAIYRQGYLPVIPHINSWAIFGLNGERGNDFDITEFDLNLLSKCVALVANLKHLGQTSEGMEFEIDFCKKHLIPIYWMSEDGCSELEVKSDERR